jgi:hypothetical protein
VDHDPDDLDARESPVLQRELPALSVAFDGPAMRDLLQALFFGSTVPRCTIVTCSPGKASYVPGEGCLVRFQLTVQDEAGPGSFRPIVTGRMFERRRDAAAFLTERVTPLVDDVRDREELRAFDTTAALLEPLNMVVNVFPIDPELPTLIAATDPRRMAAVFAELPRPLLPSPIHECHIELVQYRRRHRCVLRYTMTGDRSRVGAPGPTVVYGKVADSADADAGQLIVALEAAAARTGTPWRFAIPRWLGFRPDLQLALLSAIPGEPRVKDLLEEHGASSGQQPAGLTLHEALDECARIAAELHGADVDLGPPRTLGEDLYALRAVTDPVRRASPAFGARCDAWLRQVEVLADGSAAMEPCLGHGDFTLSQAIFDGSHAGLVDFDTTCRAEPALDLGQFLAYVRVVVATEGGTAAPPVAADIADPLCERFLETYVAHRRAPVDARRLRARVRVYELTSLLRIALHSWYQLKPARARTVAAVLDDRAR